MDHRWTPAFPLATLAPGGAKLLTAQGERVAIFRTDEGAVYAVDNACPHEGYPLVQGALKGCTLTCCWHNYKFDVRDGRCVLGEESVRTFPVRVRDGNVEVDLSEPDRGAELPKRWASLEAGLLARRPGQAARELARLTQAGLPPAQLIAWCAAFDGRYAEYRSTHALPVAADALRTLPLFEGRQTLRPVAFVAELVAETDGRMPLRARPEPATPPADAAAQLRALVEAEDAPGAEALLRGMLAAGWDREALQAAMLALCADHFLDFGHALIYTVRAFELLDAVDFAFADEILGGLITSVVLGTREDLLPEWKGYRDRLAAVSPELPRLWERQLRPPAWWDRDGFIRTLLDGKASESLDKLLELLRAGVALPDLGAALAAAAAERLLRFDGAIDADPTVQEAWLDCTHRLTFVNAARLAAERWRHPDLLRLFFMAVYFVHRGKALDAPAERRFRPIAASSATVAQVLDAILRRSPEEAVGLARALLAHPADAEDLRAALLPLTMGEIGVRPIFMAHFFKTTVAAFDEAANLAPEAGWPLPILAAVRLCATEVKEQRIAQRVHEALRFVDEGRPPKRLT